MNKSKSIAEKKFSIKIFKGKQDEEEMIKWHFICFSSVYKGEKGSNIGEHSYLSWKC